MLPHRFIPLLTLPLGLIVIVGYCWENGKSNDVLPVNSITMSQSGCMVTEKIDIVRGNSMEPMISSGDELDVLYGYYQCGGIVTRGDTIILEDSATQGPYVKIVRALPGDRVHINTDGTLMVEGIMMRNSVGQVYVFDSREQNFLSLYIQGDILQDGAHFVFGDNIANSRDSRKIGGVNVASFLGKVVGKSIKQ